MVCGWARGRNFRIELFTVEVLPYDFSPYGISAVRVFAVTYGYFDVRNFRRTEFLSYGTFAVRNFRCTVFFFRRNTLTVGFHAEFKLCKKDFLVIKQFLPAKVQLENWTFFLIQKQPGIQSAHCCFNLFDFSLCVDLFSHAWFCRACS